MRYQLTQTDIVIRHNDDDSLSFIPDDPLNHDRAMYDAWLADDNTPDIADPLLEPEPTQPEQLDQLVAGGKTALASATTIAEVKAVFAGALDGLGAIYGTLRS